MFSNKENLLESGWEKIESFAKYLEIIEGGQLHRHPPPLRAFILNKYEYLYLHIYYKYIGTEGNLKLGKRSYFR